MGYETYFELDLLEINKTKAHELEAKLCQDPTLAEHQQNLAEQFAADFEQRTKWYDSHENLIEYSKQYPDVIFILSGEGEEAEDLWKSYYKNGKGQQTRAVITYPDYDENLLI